MALDERLHRVIQALYDAAVDEARWPQALSDLLDYTASQGATFWMLNGSVQFPTFIYVNFDSKFADEYLAGMAPQDPTIQYLVRHPHQKVVHDALVIGEREKDRHPYYDWQRRWSDIRYRLVGQIRSAEGGQAGVALHRTAKVGRYESDEIDRFGFLHRHLEHAVNITLRLGTLSAMEKCTSELLDRHPAAILLVDARKRVVYANRRAEELRTRGDGIRWSAHGLAPARKSENDRLKDLIARALTRVAVDDSVQGGILRATRPSGKRPYVIVVVPVSARAAALAAFRPEVCVMVIDPECEDCLPGERLQKAFGLTPAESQLAALLAKGEDLRTAADKLNITYGTARTRLSVILEKTETGRQGDLIRVLLTTLGTL